MKKLFLIVTAIYLALAGCSQKQKDSTEEPTKFEAINNLDGVTMIAKEGAVSATGLTVILENNSDKEITYGADFLLEKKIKGKWYQVPFAIGGNHAFTDIGYSLASFNVREVEIDWGWLYGSLDHGEYRIAKEIVDFRNAGGYDKYHLVAEFTVE
ncbi:immunoglobulin-like domain-containing protein [Lysinibacillus louembei]|uniref:Immunoglobulin-like domain-containing protein n=1 Tax=Lysinibacillus louembei TaxID=1470088 RepID=A0ABZ0RSJ6_9BACI|nr:immunoglobulin-like domain-containing protein [Lysinibacillus louembei]WPK11202.1 immunoglobulin-like domain-containing protein [Lysinibacillus louembei]